MTKLVYDADFRLYVYPEMREYDESERPYFEGIYLVPLNSHAQIYFVPDVSDVCPPWTREAIADIGRISSERDARIFQVLTSEYSVTPNARLAGTEEVVRLLTRVEPPDPDPWAAEPKLPTHGVVWYVAPDEWRSLHAELEQLNEVAHSEVSSVRFSQIDGTRLARFLEERFLPSGKVALRHLRTLRRA
jgi:hypothetical protein